MQYLTPLLVPDAHEESASTPAESSHSMQTGVTRTRWWVLLQYSLLTFNQGWYINPKPLRPLQPPASS